MSFACCERQAKTSVDHHERERGQRHDTPEHPAPAGTVDKQAAPERSRDCRNGEHRSEETDVTASLARGHDVAHDHECKRHQPASAEPLECTGGNELVHGLGERAKDGADQEQRDRRLIDDSSSEQIGHLAVQRSRDRGREQVHRDHPGNAVSRSEVTSDGGQGCGNHALLGRR